MPSAISSYSRRLPPDPSISVGFVGSVGRAAFTDLVLRACPGLETCYRTGSRKALTAALAAGALDVAVHPGAIEPGAESVLLGEDRIEVAMAAANPLAGRPFIGLATLRLRSVLLPAEGDEGDFRRLAQVLVPGLARITERPIPALAEQLAGSDALALVAAGQADELGRAVVTRPIAGVDTRFPIRLAWSAGATGECLDAMLDLLAAERAALSPTPAP